MSAAHVLLILTLLADGQMSAAFVNTPSAEQCAARGEAIGAVRPDGSVGWPWLLFGHTHLPMLSPLDATGSPVRYANSGTSLLDHALTSIEWDPARREPRLVVWTDEPDGPRRRELIADGAHLAVLDDA